MRPSLVVQKRRWGFWRLAAAGALAVAVVFMLAAVVHARTWDAQDFGARARDTLSLETGRDLSRAPTMVANYSDRAKMVCVTEDVGAVRRTYVIGYYRGTIRTQVNRINTPANPTPLGGIDADVSFMCRPVDGAAAEREMRDSFGKQSLP